MSKKVVITFIISLLIIATVSVILLMLMIPQQSASVTGSVNEYKKINTNDYKFEQTKDISKDALVKQYTISYEDLAKFNKQNNYKPGNTNPFSSPTDVGNDVNNGNQGNTNGNITNGNNGVPNPPASEK